MNFAMTFDYLCPFARNAGEAVLAGLEQGAGWTARFVAFSLAQAHVEDGDPDVWDEPDGKPGVLALQWGVATRDHHPEAFPAVHKALFSARHDHGLDIKDPQVIAEAVRAAGADADAIGRLVASGTPLEAVAREHTEAVHRWRVFGVPTFITDEGATFIRFMERGNTDHLERALGMLDWGGLNEFKRTTIPR